MKRVGVFALVASIMLTGCSKWNTIEDDNGPYQGMSAKQLFTDAEKEINKGEYSAAAKRLEALESLYPFSNYTEKAQLDLIYTYYQKQDYPSAAATADRFIHLYPRANRVDYAYYMKGLANFQQTRGTFSTVLPFDESWRDPGTATQAYNDLTLLVQRFPNSAYKANALQRLLYLRNIFAQHELNIATYYFDRKMYVAAEERASFLVKAYPQAPSVEQALLVIYRSDKALGLNRAAEEALAVYERTYHKKFTH